MNNIIRTLLAVGVFTVAGAASAVPVFTGDVTGGGAFSDSVDSADGWVTDSPAGNGVDFWTIDVDSSTWLSVAVGSAIDFGISIYKGAVQDNIGYAFDNDADFIDPSSFNPGVFIAGTPSYGVLGSSLTDIFLADGGIYTIAVGGDDFGFGGPYQYDLEVSAVPEPGIAALLAMGLVGLLAFRNRRGQ